MRQLLALLFLLPSLALADITVVGSGTATSGVTNTTAATPSIHASTTTDDIIIAITGYSHDSADGGTISAVSGYTRIASVVDDVDGLEVTVDCKVAGSSESAPSIGSADGGSGTGDVKIAQTFTLRGALADCSSIVAHSNSARVSSNPANIPHVGLTVTEANTAIVAVGAKRDDVTSADALTTDSLSWSEVVEATTATGDDITIVASVAIQTTAASIGTGAWSVVPSTTQTGDTASIILSLKPAAGGGPGSPPAGKADVTVASIGADTWCEDFNTTATPDIAAGDTIRIDEATSPGGLVLTHGTDCSLEYSGNDSRQFVEYEIYDDSVGDWMTGGVDGVGTLVFNNLGATCDQPADLFLDVGAAMSTFDLDDLCLDAEGDSLTYAVTSGTLPTGVSLNGSTGALTGTPTVENESGASVTFTATDPYGATATQSMTLYPLDTITVPTCTGGVDVGTCVASIDATLFLQAGTTNYQCSESVAASDVISQSPAAAAEAAPFTSINLVVSTGACTNKRPVGVRINIGVR